MSHDREHSFLHDAVHLIRKGSPELLIDQAWKFVRLLGLDRFILRSGSDVDDRPEGLAPCILKPSNTFLDEIDLEGVSAGLARCDDTEVDLRSLARGEDRGHRRASIVVDEHVISCGG